MGLAGLKASKRYGTSTLEVYFAIDVEKFHAIELTLTDSRLSMMQKFSGRAVASVVLRYRTSWLVSKCLGNAKCRSFNVLKSCSLTDRCLLCLLLACWHALCPCSDVFREDRTVKCADYAAAGREALGIWALSALPASSCSHSCVCAAYWPFFATCDAAISNKCVLQRARFSLYAPKFVRLCLQYANCCSRAAALPLGAPCALHRPI